MNTPKKDGHQAVAVALRLDRHIHSQHFTSYTLHERNASRGTPDGAILWARYVRVGREVLDLDAPITSLGWRVSDHSPREGGEA